MSIPHNFKFDYPSDCLWDPFEILKIYNEDYGSVTCQGYAPSCRRRCRNPPNAAQRGARKESLEYISTQQPDFYDLETELRDLAKDSLCKRYHSTPSQVQYVLGNWKRAMNKAALRQPLQSLRKEVDLLSLTIKAVPFPPLQVYHPQQQVPTSSGQAPISYARRSSFQKVEVEEVFAKDSYTTNAEEDEIEDSEDDSEDDTEDEISEAEEQEEEPSSLSRLNTDTSSLEEAQPPTPPQTPNKTGARAMEIVGISISPPASAIKINQVSNINNIPAGPCTIAHSIRRPLTEECIVCKESCGEDLQVLVWCKSTCGHNLHLSCFEEWRPWAEKSRGGLRCPLWYVRLIHCFSTRHTNHLSTVMEPGLVLASTMKNILVLLNKNWMFGPKRMNYCCFSFWCFGSFRRTLSRGYIVKLLRSARKTGR